MNKPIRVAIIGATGYTGRESMRLLANHPQAQVSLATARGERCGPVHKQFPELRGRVDYELEALSEQTLAERADVVFCCLPHKEAMGFVAMALGQGLRVVDFSADYRLKDTGLYEQVYQVPHTDRDNLSHAVYGLPEFFSEQVRSARLVANPGCYPTAASLALGPLLQQGLIEREDIIVNAVSGVSGAGRTPKPAFHFPDMTENLYAYGVGNHRHQPEIEQTLSAVSGEDVSVLFQPHVVCADRGILESIYARPTGSISVDQLNAVYDTYYGQQPFVRLVDRPPTLRDAAYSNFCDLYVAVVKDRIVVFSAIDNLIKGAAGQAVQNMNIMFGLEQTCGLL